MFLVLLFTVRFIVESVKENQGGLKMLDYFQQDNSIPFILMACILLSKPKKLDKHFLIYKERYFNIDLTLFFWHKKNANSDC
jgi:prolipoprotein diacylglyceryltransferase